MIVDQPYKHRILVMSLGSSPAIITETLYALAQQDVPFYPTQLHIITTGYGQALFEQHLQGDNSPLKRLISQLQLPDNLLCANHIHVIHQNGQPLADIHNQQHNLAVGDFFTHTIKQLIEQDPDHTQIHASLAGGRKTMSYYMGFAMSLFGRAQDQLSHVTLDVEPPPPGFYYPQPIDQLSPQQQTQRQQAIDRDHPMFKQGYDYHNLPIRIMWVPFIQMASEHMPNTDTSFSLYLHCQQLTNTAPQFTLHIDHQNGKHTLSLQLGQNIQAPISFSAALAVVYYAQRQSQHGFGWIRDIHNDFDQQLQSMVNTIAACSALPIQPKLSLTETINQCEDLDSRTRDNLLNIIETGSAEDLRNFIDNCKTRYQKWLQNQLFKQAADHYGLQSQPAQAAAVHYHTQQGYSPKAAKKWYGFQATPGLSIQS